MTTHLPPRSAVAFALSFIIAVPFLPAQSTARPAGEYVVRFETSPSLRAIVTAHYSEPATRLRMGTGAIDHLPDMWGTFVHELSASDESGNPVAVEVVRDTLLGRTWNAANSATIRSVKYWVDLKFTEERWPPGNEQAGLWRDGALFLTTRALFVAPEHEGSWRVSFNLDPSWQLSQPWSALSNGNTAVAPTLSSLFGNTIVVGKYASYHFTSGDFDITLALPGSNAAGKAVLRETFEPVLAEYVRVFGGTPSSRYLMTIFTGDEEDGEGYESSSAFRTNVPINRAMRIVWGNTLAHELLHMWNGHQLKGDDHALSEWFQEGFTEYLTNRTLLRTGMISPADFLRKNEVNVSHYMYFRTSGLFDTVSVRKSGTRKWRNRFGVYNGGWATAFALDESIRELTQDKRSIDDFLRLLYQRYAVKNEPWTFEKLVAAATETAGSDMSGFFSRYVDGLEPLPLADLYQHLGLTLVGQGYAGEMYLRLSDDITTATRARRDAFLCTSDRCRSFSSRAREAR